MDNDIVGVVNLPDQRYRSFCKKGLHYNILVIGSAGSGKSTLINNILKTDALKFNPYTNLTQLGETKMLDLNLEETEQDLLKDKYYYSNSVINIQESKFLVQERGIIVYLNITEVDGFGDCVDNSTAVDPVLKLIEKKYLEYKEEEKTLVERSIIDNRFHVCLYVTDATSNYKPLDTIALKRLSRVCNVIPIVTKSDILTIGERAEHERVAKSRLSVDNVQALFFRSRSYWSNRPFYTSCGHFTDNGDNVREHSWGTLEVEKLNGNDLTRVRDLLVRESVLELKDRTKKFYEVFKARDIFGSIFEGRDAQETIESLEKLLISPCTKG